MMDLEIINQIIEEVEENERIDALIKLASFWV
jgi:hypothetical protein